MPRYKTGKGTIIEIAPAPEGTTANTAVFERIVGAYSFEVSAIEAAEVDVSSFDSDGWVETIQGTKDAGEVSVTMRFDAGSDTDLMLEAFALSGESAFLRITQPNSTNTPRVRVFNGWVKGYGDSSDHESVGDATLTFRNYKR